MNIGALIPLGLILLAFAWGIWMIFKQNPSSVNLAKLFSYFVGVVLTLLAVLWIVTSFVPWWGVRLVQKTRGSGNVRELETLSHDLWEDAMDNVIAKPTTEIVTPEAPPQATPAAGGEIVPTATPEAGAESPSVSSQSATAESTYTVQSGDTLYSISRKYPGVSVDAIKTRNNLTDDIIKIDQKLVIPATP